MGATQGGRQAGGAGLRAHLLGRNIIRPGDAPLLPEPYKVAGSAAMIRALQRETIGDLNVCSGRRWGMKILFDTALMRVGVARARRMWRSRLTEDTPSWTAAAIVKAMSATPAADPPREHQWQCARAPALVRLFRRTRRRDERSTLRSLPGAGIAVLAVIGGLAGDANAATISLRATMSQLKLVCSRTGGDFMSGSDGYSCITYNCDGRNGSCAVICNNDGICTGTMPAPPRGIR